MDNLRIIGIDPGNNLGISIFTLNKNLQIEHIETQIHYLNNFTYYMPNPNKHYKLVYLEKITQNLLHKYNPLAISIEEPFINTKFPNAITSLAKYMAIMELAIIKTAPYVSLKTYAPKLIKSTITSGCANKDDMKLGVHNIQELSVHLPQLEQLTEHEVDATAIAYTLLLEIRANSFLFITTPW